MSCSSSSAIARVVRLQLVVRDLVDPRANGLTEQLAAGLAADGVGDCADRVGGIDEAERHLANLGGRGLACGAKVDAAADGTAGAARTLFPASRLAFWRVSEVCAGHRPRIEEMSFLEHP